MTSDSSQVHALLNCQCKHGADAHISHEEPCDCVLISNGSRSLVHQLVICLACGGHALGQPSHVKL